MSSITFFGGAGSVTGSKHLIEAAGKRILFDCGTFQGLPDVRERNRSFSFAPDSIDAVVLSHAHLDHCGMLPLLVKRGYTGRIFATAATREVTQRMLEDMAGIEGQDAEYRLRHHIGSPDDRVPLITPEDILPLMEQFTEIPYARDDPSWHEIVPGVRIKLYDAGHILGSSIIVLEYEEDGKQHTIAYTGDMGPIGVPLLHDPEIPKEPIEMLLMESTYGNRTHLPLAEAKIKLAEAIKKVCDRQGIMVVPAFSLGRTQMLVYIIHLLVDSGAIPRFPIYVDSPLATDITEVYRAHADMYDNETRIDFSRQGDRPLAFRNLEYIQSAEQSKALNGKKGPFMVISASGMMTAGRVVHHLKNTISNPNNAVFITGYQARGTTGRRILSGAKNIELHGEWFPVRSEVFLFNEFSAHADQGQLVAFAKALPSLKQVALVHGEEQEARALQGALIAALPHIQVTYPHEGDTIAIVDH
ncbi:MAG TPA: MBL fold metallo-hydrolase [Candidatus Andersenbacteria bacterium]|nr:MBL fold metallo-hydrolase [Candidatus Andersenbacteria bacterium]